MNGWFLIINSVFKIFNFLQFPILFGRPIPLKFFYYSSIILPTKLMFNRHTQVIRQRPIGECCLCHMKFKYQGNWLIVFTSLITMLITCWLLHWLLCWSWIWWTTFGGDGGCIVSWTLVVCGWFVTADTSRSTNDPGFFAVWVFLHIYKEFLCSHWSNN